jgi:hypothetical protein
MLKRSDVDLRHLSPEEIGRSPNKNGALDHALTDRLDHATPDTEPNTNL